MAVRPGRVALLGNPNTGKTTLFNHLCGLRTKTSNFPGTTTAIRRGFAVDHDRRLEICDLPGLYELQSNSPEAAVALKALTDPAAPTDAVIVVIDACNLTRNLVLCGELLALGLPMVVALNMMDMAHARGITINLGVLANRLGCPVVPIVARRGTGVDAIRDAIDGALMTRPRMPVELRGAPTLEQLTAWAEGVTAASVTGGEHPSADDVFGERADRFLTDPVYGMAVFVAVMCGLFWVLFVLASVPMDLIESLFGGLASWVTGVLPPGPVQDLVIGGIIGGLSGTIVFLPQIALLFFLISLLEDTGYLARAAFVMDRLLSRFGLPGQAFVPLLTSHACALPGIMSARLIPNRRDRLATILVAPFMSCSARVPVYVLLTSLLFANRPGLAALAFAGCYLLGAAAGLLTAGVFGKTALRGTPRPLILELPPYRRPSLRNALLSAKDQSVSFLRSAGTVIMAICIVLWWLSAYPRTEAPPEAASLRAEAAVAAPDRAEELRAEASALEARAQQAGSFAGRIGRFMEPAFAPLGFDWQLTLGVVSSFMAREVFVSTMSVLEGGNGDADVDAGVVERIRAMTRDDGTLLFTPATCAAALVFFVLAMQCLPTLAVTRRETGSTKYALLQLGYMSTLAYIAAGITYQLVRLAGVS
ncbi:MAG TPA: ferrous iron transporter B [Vicinamibacterales bacterium]|nr:ferrous iron transporter B [Vicinamibacterales bacterium]